MLSFKCPSRSSGSVKLWKMRDCPHKFLLYFVTFQILSNWMCCGVVKEWGTKVETSTFCARMYRYKIIMSNLPAQLSNLFCTMNGGNKKFEEPKWTDWKPKCLLNWVLVMREYFTMGFELEWMETSGRSEDRKKCRRRIDVDWPVIYLKAWECKATLSLWSLKKRFTHCSRAVFPKINDKTCLSINRKKKKDLGIMTGMLWNSVER